MVEKYRDWLERKRQVKCFLFTCFLWCALYVFSKNFLTPRPQQRALSQVHRLMLIATHECASTPLMTHEESETIAKYLHGSDVLFEWGGGFGSCVWSVFVSELITIEHDKKWYRKIAHNARTNQRFVLIPREPDYENYCIHVFHFIGLSTEP